MDAPLSGTAPVFSIENEAGRGSAVIVCEHGSNLFPPEWGDLGTTAKIRSGHGAFDPGALDLARALARHLDAPLISAGLSRLIYDLDHPPHVPAAMPIVSKTHKIPGNRALTTTDRLRRVRQIYLPFHAALSALLAERLVLGMPTALLTVHSFDPVYFGLRQNAELRVQHDADPTLARRLAKAATAFSTRLTAPSGSSGETSHTLARHATPLNLRHAMLELRSDLLAEDAPGVAARLAPLLSDAIGAA